MNIYDYRERLLLLRSQSACVLEKFGHPTFTSTLRIDRALMKDQTLEALSIAEVKFHDAKCPDTRQAVLDCVCDVINTCNALSIPFPAIFLLRQKQLHDGDFSPTRRSAPLFEARR